MVTAPANAGLRAGFLDVAPSVIHAVYAGVKMKSALRAQVADFFNGRNGRAGHATYRFLPLSATAERIVRALFNRFANGGSLTLI